MVACRSICQILGKVPKKQPKSRSMLPLSPLTHHPPPLFSLHKCPTSATHSLVTKMEVTWNGDIEQGLILEKNFQIGSILTSLSILTGFEFHWLGNKLCIYSQQNSFKSFHSLWFWLVLSIWCGPKSFRYSHHALVHKSSVVLCNVHKTTSQKISFNVY